MKTSILKQALLVTVFFLAGLSGYGQPKAVPAFRVSVSGKGRPMLFIPGATCSGAVWNETVAYYAKTNQCHVFTLAGYAGTAPLAQGPYLETFKTALINYIKTNNLQHVVLVGHSIGGFLSLCTAISLQERLEKVIIVDGLPFYAGVMNPAAKSGFNEEQAKSTFATYQQMTLEQLKANQLAVARTMCADSTKWNLIASWGASSDRRTMAYTMSEMLGNDLRPQIAAITVPVLVLAAYAPVPEYPTFTKEYAEALYKQQYQACTTCVIRVSPPAKHFIMYDAPEWFLQQMDSFTNLR